MKTKKVKIMITWNLDCSNYTIEQLTALAYLIESMDYAIAKEIYDYIESWEIH